MAMQITIDGSKPWAVDQGMSEVHCALGQEPNLIPSYRVTFYIVRQRARRCSELQKWCGVI